ncbi:hypothetical protein [Salininema proteolyticum]|uniref:Scaffolding protein n=1 Tax=Salininema proteolyticum TaxID=1607685 RepID=A0ABV8TWN6_9ACTN
MADQPDTRPSTESTPTEPDSAPEPDTEPDNGELGEAGLKALQAERDERKALQRKLRELEPLAEKAREFEESQKSEMEKLSERLQAAERDAETARSEALRYQVASRHGVGDEDAKLFLTGADEELLQKQAKRLAQLSTDKSPGKPRRSPVEELGLGMAPVDDNTAETDMNEWIRRHS